ncbi:MAG TPA: hypothetical protein VHW73_02665, partial [Rudaea sp.]|nr:hypothetical protein [Rudaea sp.]
MARITDQDPLFYNNDLAGALSAQQSRIRSYLDQISDSALSSASPEDVLARARREFHIEPIQLKESEQFGESEPADVDPPPNAYFMSHRTSERRTVKGNRIKVTVP